MAIPDLPSLRRKVLTAAPRAAVLWRPSGAFFAVAQRPLWALMLVVAGAFSLLPPLTFLARADVVEVTTKQLKKSGRWEQMPAEQRELALEAAPKAMAVFLPLGAVAKRESWIGALAVLSFVVLRGARPTLRLGVLLAAAALGTAPLFIHDVLTALSFVALDINGLDAQNVVLSNVAAFLPAEQAETPWGIFLRGLDFFELWSCGLVGYGLAAVAGGRSRLPYALAFGGHAVFTLIPALVAFSRG